MRLQVATRDGVTQLDPQKSGIRQKGVLAFRVLQTPWNLALDIEQVDPWIQVTSLQHATVSEAQVKVAANLQYQIENTGLESVPRFPSDERGERALSRRSGGRFSPVVPDAVNERLAAMGGEIAPARHRAISLAGHVSDAGARSSAGDRAARRAGRGRESATRLRHRAIRRTLAGARGRAARRASADRMAEHPARAPAGSDRVLRELRLPARRAGVSAAVEARTPRSREAPARARQQHHLHLGDLRRRRDAHPGAPRNVARRQAPAPPHAAEGRAILVRLRESKRRLAVARAGRPDSDSARTAIARRPSRCRWRFFTAARSASPVRARST